MGFWFLGFLFIAFIGFFVWLSTGQRKAGKDAERARQAEYASKARRDAQEAENAVNRQSDDAVLDELRDHWTRK